MRLIMGITHFEWDLRVIRYHSGVIIELTGLIPGGIQALGYNLTGLPVHCAGRLVDIQNLVRKAARICPAEDAAARFLFCPRPPDLCISRPY